MLLFSDLLIWLNLYDDQIACQCWCRQSANTWHTKLKSGASNLHGAGASNLQDNNIHAYDEDVKWQLAEPGALMSAKNYRDKKALPLVEKLKEVVKNLTIKCVQLTEQSKKLTAKMDGQQKQISRLTDKVMEQNDTIDRLQEKASDLGRLERHLGTEQVQSIVERSKALEQAERAKKRPKRAFEMSR